MLLGNPVKGLRYSHALIRNKKSRLHITCSKLYNWANNPQMSSLRLFPSWTVCNSQFRRWSRIVTLTGVTVNGQPFILLGFFDAADTAIHPALPLQRTRVFLLTLWGRRESWATPSRWTPRCPDVFWPALARRRAAHSPRQSCKNSVLPSKHPRIHIMINNGLSYKYRITQNRRSFFSSPCLARCSVLWTGCRPRFRSQPWWTCPLQPVPPSCLCPWQHYQGDCT